MGKNTRRSLFDRLKKGLEIGIAHARGEIKLKTRELRGSKIVPTRKDKELKERK
jgi:hypothetical protein